MYRYCTCTKRPIHMNVRSMSSQVKSTFQGPLGQTHDHKPRKGVRGRRALTHRHKVGRQTLADAGVLTRLHVVGSLSLPTQMYRGWPAAAVARPLPPARLGPYAPLPPRSLPRGWALGLGAGWRLGLGEAAIPFVESPVRVQYSKPGRVAIHRSPGCPWWGGRGWALAGKITHAIRLMVLLY